MLRYVPAVRVRARNFRKGQTDAERKLWSRLRARQLNSIKFRRQHPIGQYIVDFCCTDYRLVIELDGGHHVQQADEDLRRTAMLVQRGYRVLRFWDHEVLKDIDAVLQEIYTVISYPHPSPLPERERETKNVVECME